MESHVREVTSATAMNQHGQYGASSDDKDLGAGGILLLLGVTIGIYAFSPGARHWYEHGHLPPYRRCAG